MDKPIRYTWCQLGQNLEITTQKSLSSRLETPEMLARSAWIRFEVYLPLTFVVLVGLVYQLHSYKSIEFKSRQKVLAHRRSYHWIGFPWPVHKSVQGSWFQVSSRCRSECLGFSFQSRFSLNSISMSRPFSMFFIEQYPTIPGVDSYCPEYLDCTHHKSECSQSQVDQNAIPSE